MKKHTIKRLCGVAGLLVVGAMTAVAVNMPGPKVQAVEDNASTTVTVRVNESKIHAWYDGVDENGDPFIKTNFPAEACRLEYQATNLSSGVDLFNPLFSVTIPNPHPSDNTLRPALPFADNGAVAGDYNVIVTGYDCSQPEQSVGADMVMVSYSGTVVPKTGDTGELNVLGVNLARADFIAIGLLILAAAIVCIILSVRKKNHSNLKRR